MDTTGHTLVDADAIALEYAGALRRVEDVPDRPTEYTDEVFFSVLERHAGGATLRTIARDDAEAPTPTTMRRWLIGRSDRMRAFEDASILHAHALMEQGTDLGRAAATASQQRVKGLQVATQALFKAAALKAPSHYGDRAGAGPGVTVNINTTLDLSDAGGDVIEGSSTYHIVSAEGPKAIANASGR